MVTCKENCFCYSVCTKIEAYAHNPKLNLPNPSECIYFKDLSKFIELPCKVGDTVYIHYYNREKAKYEVTPIKNIQLSELAVLIEDNENVYLSEEEAEQALREREPNE